MTVVPASRRREPFVSRPPQAHIVQANQSVYWAHGYSQTNGTGLCRSVLPYRVLMPAKADFVLQADDATSKLCMVSITILSVVSQQAWCLCVICEAVSLCTRRTYYLRPCSGTLSAYHVHLHSFAPRALC